MDRRVEDRVGRAGINNWLDLYLITFILGLMAFIFGILPAAFTFAATGYRPDSSA